MSLQEVYRLAHTAECRLTISNNRPDRNLRVVIGHLLHYESLRLRIVEIEHDISRSQRTQAVSFQGTGHVGDTELKRTVSIGDLKRRSPPPAPVDEDEEDLTDSDSAEEDTEVDGDLSLARFPTGSSKPPPLITDVDEDADDDSEPQSPEDPDDADIEQALKGPDHNDLVSEIEKVRQCPCHGHTDSPGVEHVWTLPPSEKDKPGVTRAVVQVAA